MAPSGQYRLDSNDWYDEYGFVVESGSEDFLKPAEPKPRPSKDWADENGTEYDTTAPLLKEKKISITGCIVAQSKAEFWDRYDAMFTVLVSGGLRKMYVADLDRYFDLLWDGCSKSEKLTPITPDIDGNTVSCRYTLDFIQPSPFASSAPGNYPTTFSNVFTSQFQ